MRFRLLIIACFSAFAFTSCGNGNNKGSAIAGVNTHILLFNGEGVSANDVTAVEMILDNSHLDYATVTSAELNAMSASQLLSYRLLIVPGGDFMVMGNSLTPKSSANVRNAIQQGLNYLGICAGAFLAGRSTYYNGFDLTSGKRFAFYSAENKGVRKAAVAIAYPGTPPQDQYWEDGPQLSGWGAVVAKYPDSTPAITEGKCGNGFVVLSGVHPEAPANWRHNMLFNTPATVDNAYAAILIHAALNGETLPHY